MIIRVYSTRRCGYCRMAERLLDERELSYEEIDCSDDPELRRTLVARTGRRTVPQIFFDEVPIGGFEELLELARSGELERILRGELGAPSVLDDPYRD